MDAVNRTLFIPLYGKAWVSRRGLLLEDPDAEHIWAEAGFPLRGKAASKWLAYTMAMRAAIFDNWLSRQVQQWPDAVVLHLGCGLDSRCRRVSCENTWYDVDFPEVMEVRRAWFPETDRYHLVSGDLRQMGWDSGLPWKGRAIVVMEGISMYLSPEEMQTLMRHLGNVFTEVRLLMDSYTMLGAKASKYKNPINEVGVTRVFGFDNPVDPVRYSDLTYVRERDMTPETMIAQLPGREQGFFRTFFAGRMAKKFYRLYEYNSIR